MRRRCFTLSLTAILLALATPIFAAGVPGLISYQGKLRDAVGKPVDATASITFAIYSSGVGTSPLWSETQSSVRVMGGLFHVLLGSVTPIILPPSAYPAS